MHIANQLLFRTLIILGKKLLPNLSVLHFKKVNWLKFLKLYTRFAIIFINLDFLAVGSKRLVF